MGFIRANMLPLLKEHRLRPFSGHVLCLGRPDVYFSYEHLLRMARIADVILKTEVAVTPSPRPDFAAKGYISGETVFASIGFSQVSSLDHSSFEGADFEFDMNLPELPNELRHKFDVVIDHGTIEHIFHIPNVLKNIYELLKIGGRVIHNSPGSNYFDHGFYMFSPTLFHDFYTVNKWMLNTIQVFQTTSNQEFDPPFFTDYEPGLFDSFNGRLGNEMYGTICIATKTPQSTGTVIPQQGYYQRLQGWQTGITETEQPLLPLRKNSSKFLDTLIGWLKTPFKNLDDSSSISQNEVLGR